MTKRKIRLTKISSRVPNTNTPDGFVAMGSITDELEIGKPVDIQTGISNLAFHTGDVQTIDEENSLIYTEKAVWKYEIFVNNSTMTFPVVNDMIEHIHINPDSTDLAGLLGVTKMEAAVLGEKMIAAIQQSEGELSKAITSLIPWLTPQEVALIMTRVLHDQLQEMLQEIKRKKE